MAAKVRCDFCDQLLSTKWNLKIHVKAIHLKKYNCSKCPSSYKCAENLKDHIDSVHEANKCDSCDKTYKSRKSLYQHKFYVHTNGVRCDFCDQLLSTKWNLKVHVKAVHRHRLNRHTKRIHVINKKLSQEQIFDQKNAKNGDWLEQQLWQVATKISVVSNRFCLSKPSKYVFVGINSNNNLK
jgi:hypothetical protein